MTKWTPKEISRLRTRLGLTQEKMAQKLGVSFATVNRWEKGRAAPTGLSLGILDTVEKELLAVVSARPPAPAPLLKPPVKVRKPQPSRARPKSRKKAIA